MIGAPHRFQRRGGFSLVEMMVVLFIMASLATVAAVSVGTTQDKVRADKTTAIGREVVEALERSEGLSFVSDFGRLPQDEDEFKFLFAPTLGDDRTNDPTAMPYRPLPLELPDDSKYNGVRSHFDDEEYKLGAGWRGPYSRSGSLDTSGASSIDKIEILDGWKNGWDVEFIDDDDDDDDEFDRIAFESPGRNGDYESETQEWQDKDSKFEISRTRVEHLDLQLEVSIYDDENQKLSEGDFDSDSFKLYAILFSPKSDPTDHPLFNSVSYETFEIDSESTSLPPFTGLSIGHRLVFVFAEGIVGSAPTKYFASVPRLLHIQPGVNPTEEFILTELP